MRFKLSSTSSFYNLDDEIVNYLISLGFVESEGGSENLQHRVVEMPDDENIYIEINTPEQLVEFINKLDMEIVMGSDESGHYIEIYNGYRE